MPPRRSRPRRVGLVAITTAAPTKSASTAPRIARLRLRSATAALPRREHEQQAPVVVVGGEDVRLRRLGAVALRVYHHLLVEHPHAPLERRADVVVAGLELEPQHLLRGPPDHVEVAQAGELAGAPAGADQAGLLVEDEERRVGGRVVVVEQLEQEAEAALVAAAGAALEAGGALLGDAAIPAVRADEDGHGPDQISHRLWPPLSGGSRPRWRKAALVATRPRGVRMSSPCWSR